MKIKQGGLIMGDILLRILELLLYFLAGFFITKWFFFTDWKAFFKRLSKKLEKK